MKKKDNPSVGARKEITRADVAALAGVSGMTVSRVLNRSPRVTEATRRAVLDACRRLKYRPNALASGLRHRKSRSIGVVVPTFKHTFYGRMLAALEIVMRRENYYIISIQLDPRFQSAETDWAELEFLLSRQIDGLILDVTLSPATEARLLDEAVPSVFVDAPPAEPGFDFVGTADREGMAELVRHLLAGGHRRIAYLGGLAESKPNLARRAGWEDALRGAGIEPEPSWAFHQGFNREDGMALAGRHLDELRNFTALACVNDYVASGAMVRLYEAGLRVPGDLSVTGFADDEIAAFSWPGLTTYRQPIEEIARCAAEILLGKMPGDAGKEPQHRLIPGAVVVRDSVADLPYTLGPQEHRQQESTIELTNS